jgi:phage terminase large subunit-like protein
MTDAEAEALIYDWEFWARPAQVLPLGDWITWLVMAGRGFGKTRVGAETVRGWVLTGKYRIINLIGATSSDVRDIMIEGESGILAVCPKGERPMYQPSKSRLVWPNGVVSLLFSAEEPERLRGKQHFKLWCDEVAAWRYHESWDQASFGLRLGKDPQVIVTTTPRPVKLIRDLCDDPTTKITRGSTYDNKQNLAVAFLSKVVTKYENTRLGRQELNAELLEDNPNALWQRSRIDELRITAEQLLTVSLGRIVVGVDPAVTAKKTSDDTGIVAVGRDGQSPPHYYVLCDRTVHGTPDQWASAVVKTYDEMQADRVVGETNNGGDLVESNIRNKRDGIPFKAVHATRGKVIRAEPIAALYEQGRVHHVGTFAHLEDQMCDFDPQIEDQDSPDRMDALVWAITELSEGSMLLALPEVLEMIRKGTLIPGRPTAGSSADKAKKIGVQTSSMTKPVTNEDTLHCPKCKATCIVQVGAQHHCNGCGHQWGKLAKVYRGPNRGEIRK